MGPRRRRTVPRNRGQATGQRQVVINLDGASSSGNEEPSPVKRVKKSVAEPKEGLHITLSPDKMSRGIMSDSSDSDCESECVAVTRSPAPRLPSHQNNSGSDSSDDIFSINYSAHNYQALRGAYKELNVTEGEHNQSLQSLVTHPPKTGDSDDDCRIEEHPVTPKRKQNSVDILECPPSPTLFEIDKNPQRQEPCYNTRRRGTRRRSNRTVTSASLQEEFSKKRRISINESLNLSNDVIISDEDDDDVNPEMRVRIKWGSERFQLPVRKLQKFSHLYEVLAQKYGVSADRVVLNLRDKIVNPALCPADLKVTIADIIEGGIGSLQNYSQGHPPAPQAVTQDPDSIPLRVQNSNKKGSVTIYIGLKEKMSVLMHKYAEEKQLKLEKLRFMFDGDQLCAQSTPSSLDLEGGECIDVYELT